MWGGAITSSPRGADWTRPAEGDRTQGFRVPSPHHLMGRAPSDVQERVLVPTRSTMTYDRIDVRCIVAAFCPRHSEFSDRCGDQHHRHDVTAGETGQVSGYRSGFGPRRHRLVRGRHPGRPPAPDERSVFTALTPPKPHDYLLVEIADALSRIGHRQSRAVHRLAWRPDAASVRACGVARSGSASVVSRLPLPLPRYPAFLGVPHLDELEPGVDRHAG